MIDENIFIRINLAAFNSAGVARLQGRTGIKKCLIIPIEENFLYEGNKGVYADFVGWRNEKLSGSDTHLIKQSLSKEVRETLSNEERMALPTFGSVRPMQVSEIESNETSQDFANANIVDDNADLPF